MHHLWGSVNRQDVQFYLSQWHMFAILKNAMLLRYNKIFGKNTCQVIKKCT